MNKVRLRVGYTNLVLDADDAMKVFTLLNKGTLYVHDSRYVKAEGSEKSTAVEYIKPFNENITMIGVSPENYAMWKLAGESE